MTSSRQPDGLDWLCMVFLGLVWGASFIMIKKAVLVFDPIQMTLWRMVLASILALPLALAYWSKIDWKRWKPLVVVALCGSAFPNLLFAVAQQHVNSSLAGVLNSLTPIFTFIIGVSFFQLKIGWAKVLGILFGLIGAVILVLFNGRVQAEGNVFFAGLCVLATVCYAINANMVGRYLRDQPPAGIAAAAFAMTGLFFAVGLFFSGGWQVVWQHPDGLKGLGYVFYLSAIGTVGGSILYFWLMQRTSPVFATSVTYLLPVTAIAIGVLDGEAVSVMDVVGMGVIFGGLYLARG